MEIVINDDFLIMAGHTASGNIGCGAVGYIDESKENRKVGPTVVKHLKELGKKAKYIQFDKAKTHNYLKEEVDYANAQGNFNCVVQIHFNCGTKDINNKTTGCETYYLSEKGGVFAKRVEKKLSTLFTDRGTSNEHNYYWLKHTKCTAILIEVCFVDDKDDVRVYEENFDEICKLIAEGLADKDFQEIEQEEEEQVDKSTTYRIRTGGFTKEEAEEKMKYLEGLTGWWMTTKLQADGSYCIITGGFDKEVAETKLKTLIELTGWWATVEENI